MTKVWTEEEKKAFGAKMKALREAKNETPQVQKEVEAPVVPVQPPTIKLRFRKYVEITIGGKRFVGYEIEVKEMKIASEIVRIAKEHYGWDVLI